MMDGKCDRFYFYDRSVGNCISCEDTCNPYRHATESECQIHCSAYLHDRSQFTTAGDRELPVAATQSGSLMMMILVMVLGSIVVVAAVVAVLVCLILRYRRRLSRSKNKGNCADDIEPKHELQSLNCKEIPINPFDPPQFGSSSLCEQSGYHSIVKTSGHSIVKTPDVIETPRRSVASLSTSKIFSQETETEGSPMSPTRLKETSSFAIQHQNESASPVIDLHEDFDCVEQTFDLAPRVRHGADAIVSNFSFDDDGKKNLRIASILQRLRWVKQFWWDVEGAKIVVEASRQSTAKEDITKILQREGILSSEFSFELVIPPLMFIPDSSSIDSERNS